MARKMVNLPDELVARLEAIAASRGIGLSTLVRMLLYASLERPAEQPAEREQVPA